MNEPISTSQEIQKGQAWVETMSSNPTTATILARRSIRTGFSGRVGEVAVLREIVACGLAAPSSKNARPWRFHVVKDHELLVAIADAASGAEDADSYVPRDPATGKPRADWSSTVLESAQVLREAPVAIFVENLGAFSSGRDTLVDATSGSLRGSLVGYTFEVLGIGAALGNMMTAAASLDVRSVYMGDIVIAEEFVADRLGLEVDLVGVLALGYSNVRKHPRIHDVDDPGGVVWH